MNEINPILQEQAGSFSAKSVKGNAAGNAARADAVAKTAASSDQMHLSEEGRAKALSERLAGLQHARDQARGALQQLQSARPNDADGLASLRAMERIFAQPLFADTVSQALRRIQQAGVVTEDDLARVRSGVAQEIDRLDRLRRSAGVALENFFASDAAVDGSEAARELVADLSARIQDGAANRDGFAAGAFDADRVIDLLS